MIDDSINGKYRTNYNVEIDIDKFLKDLDDNRFLMDIYKGYIKYMNTHKSNADFGFDNFSCAVGLFQHLMELKNIRLWHDEVYNEFLKKDFILKDILIKHGIE